MKFTRSLLSITTLLSLMGCNSDDDKPAVVEPVPVEISIEGIWYSRDYGEIKLIESEEVMTLQVTNDACMPSITLDPYALIAASNELTDISLQYNRPYDSASVTYERIYDIYAICTNGMISSLADGESYIFDAQQVFSTFWHDMNTHYAFFDERNINWQEIYSLYYDDLAAASEDELKIVFDEILSQLKDGHTSITFGFGGDDISYFSKPSLEEQLYQDGIDLNLTEEQSYQYAEAQLALIVNNVSEYLTENSRAEFLIRHVSNQVNQEHSINWGIIEKNEKRIGYLVVDHFVNFDNYEGIERTDITPYNEKFDEIIEQVLVQLADTDELILDIRNNGGGYDMQGLQLARRFMAQDHIAWDISAFYQGEFNFQAKVQATPHTGTRYLKPISVLISPSTFSAAETFSMVMHNLPQVTMVGEETGGATSDTMPRLLPNHWFYNLSNEYYLDSAGNNFEIMGVQPDIEVPAYDGELRAEGRDSAIETVINSY